MIAKIERRFPAPLGVARREIGDRERNDRRGNRHHRRHRHRPHDDVEVLRLEQLAIGLERELLDHQPGKVVVVEKALQQQREQRPEIDDPEPQRRRRRAAGTPAASAAARTGRRATRTAPRAPAVSRPRALTASSSITWMASLAKPSVTRSPSSGTVSLDGTDGMQLCAVEIDQQPHHRPQIAARDDGAGQSATRPFPPQ